MKKSLQLLFFIIFSTSYAQQETKISAKINLANNTIAVSQKINYTNNSTTTLEYIVLNDWNNAYSNNNTALGKRFSDEFVRSYHYANYHDRGFTNNLKITSPNQTINWCRKENATDLVKINLEKSLAPNQQIILDLVYELKIPNDKFSRFGFNNKGEMTLKNCFLMPSKLEKNQFLEYENVAIDDQVNEIGTVELLIEIPENKVLFSDLEEINKTNTTYYYKSNNVINVNLFLENKPTFLVYKNKEQEIVSNIESKKVTDIQKALIIDKVTQYVNSFLGKSNHKKILISQNDYNANAFYGLNQLPNFLNPFPNEFVFELKFLKTYLNNFLKNNFQINNRKDYWLQDAIEIYLISKYIDENYPNSKMMGNIAKIKLLKGYHLINLDFNDQFDYFFMLMQRKNLDQALNEDKSNLIKYNDKIGSKYYAGKSFIFLNNYLNNNKLDLSIKEFSETAKKTYSNTETFKNILQKNTNQDLNWFFDEVINSRKIIDYSFKNVKKIDSTISFSLKNKNNSKVPIPVYGLKKKEVIFKKWIANTSSDSTYTITNSQIDKLIINQENIVPEFNRKNNYKSLKKFNLFNKPLKFNLVKDLENPAYNQVLFTPEFGYNLYDGLIFGLSFDNNTILDRYFNYSINPSYSSKSKDITGSFFVNFKQYNRNNHWFSTRYGVGCSFFHYAPDASYQKITPYISFRKRQPNFRENHTQIISFREVYVNREPSKFVKNTFEGSYAVFDARYINSKTEITKHFGYTTDLQLGVNFGKLIGEISYRHLFNNRQVNVRGYFGTFLYNNSNTNYFDFALNRPTDYLFDYNYLGRSETSGLFSQQYIAGEGGFKSKIPNQLASKWLASVNASTNIWNWIEVYSDFGIMKSNNQPERFVYDSGIRLNLVTDYFELYLPVHSTNGWEISQPKYAEKIRFIIAFSPKALTGLFTRKWF